MIVVLLSCVTPLLLSVCVCFQSIQVGARFPVVTPPWSSFTDNLKYSIASILIWLYEICACVSWLMKSFVKSERVKRKKLILAFRVSRCQGVMFYLKENNLRYWSGGVRLSLSLLFPLFFTFSARMRSSDQTHVKIIFCFFPSLSRYIYICYIYDHLSEECSNDVLSCTVDFS